MNSAIVLERRRERLEPRCRLGALAQLGSTRPRPSRIRRRQREARRSARRRPASSADRRSRAPVRASHSGVRLARSWPRAREESRARARTRSSSGRRFRCWPFIHSSFSRLNTAGFEPTRSSVNSCSSSGEREQLAACRRRTSRAAPGSSPAPRAGSRGRGYASTDVAPWRFESRVPSAPRIIGHVRERRRLLQPSAW